MDLNLDDVIATAATELSPPPETPETHAAVVEAPAEVAAPEPTKADRARDESGRFAPKAKDEKAPEKAAEAPQKPEAAKPAAEVQPPAPEPQKPAEPTLKPPQSWKPAAREKWATLPPEVQQEALRRERETEQALAQTATVRREHEAFQQAARPYEMLLKAQGLSPVQAFESWGRTAATLHTGTPAQKAAVVAELMEAYGIHADTVNPYLTGEAPLPQQARPQPQQEFRDPRFDQYIAQQQAQQLAAATAAMEEFRAKHEFFDDVRQDMVDLMKARPSLTLEDAYRKAVALNEDVAAALAQRKEAEAASAAGAQTAQARAAAVSVRSQPAGITPPKPMVSIEDYVEAAAEELRAKR